LIAANGLLALKNIDPKLIEAIGNRRELFWSVFRRIIE